MWHLLENPLAFSYQPELSLHNAKLIILGLNGTFIPFVPSLTARSLCVQ